MSINLTDEPVKAVEGVNPDHTRTLAVATRYRGCYVCSRAIKVLLYCKYFIASGLSPWEPVRYILNRNGSGNVWREQRR